MENWKKDSRKDIVMVDVDGLVPQDHLLRKVERVMDYDWLYERLSPYYFIAQTTGGQERIRLC